MFDVFGNNPYRDHISMKLMIYCFNICVIMVMILKVNLLHC